MQPSSFLDNIAHDYIARLQLLLLFIDLLFAIEAHTITIIHICHSTKQARQQGSIQTAPLPSKIKTLFTENINP